MPAAAATVTAPAQAGAPVLPMVPFVRASFEHVEPANIDRSNAIGANSVLLGPDDIPAYGYLRSLLVFIEATGGTGAAAVYKEDAPWSAIQEITIHDVNGAPIVGPIGGYDLYLINRYGGYSGWADPTVSPVYVTPATSGNFSFMLRVPIEISSRDGLGALPNMNSSATYKVRTVQAAQTDIYSTNPTTLPSMRYRVWAECWAAPGGQAPNGQPQAVQPPAVGTTQMWSKYISNINAGQNTVQFRRVGSPIREMILVFRTATPARSTTNFPDPIQLYLDSKLLVNEGRGVRQHYMRERLTGALAPETGVLVYDYIHDFDGLYGGEMRDNWLPTIQSTRLELQGSFGAAGTLTILTNDIAVVGNPYLD